MYYYAFLQLFKETRYAVSKNIVLPIIEFLIIVYISH